MSKKAKLSSSIQATAELAREEFSNPETLIELNNIFKDLAWGTVEITVVEGEIENIKITRNYKPYSTVDETE